jgi:hypothetical protein
MTLRCERDIIGNGLIDQTGGKCELGATFG